MLIKYIVYIMFGFKTMQVKWIFELVIRTLWNQTLIWRQSVRIYGELYCINSVQSIFFGISPIVKQYHMLPSFITF